MTENCVSFIIRARNTEHGAFGGKVLELAIRMVPRTNGSVERAVAHTLGGRSQNWRAWWSGPRFAKPNAVQIRDQTICDREPHEEENYKNTKQVQTHVDSL